MVSGGEKLQLSYTLEQEVVSTGAFNAFAVLHLNAPEINFFENGKRPKLAITAVLDRSGSMSGAKLDLTKTAMHFITEQLNHDDLFGIVTCDDHAATEFELTKVDQKKQFEILQKINGIHTGGSTNLSGGLLSGIEQQIQARKQQLLNSTSSIVRAVLLCTDGLANEGITHTRELARITRNLISDEQNLRVHTFGFGGDHDPAMLTEIAEAGQGDFFFVESDNVIPEAFGNVLGGLLSVAAQNVRIVITPIQPSFKLVKVWDVVLDEKMLADGQTVISMRDLKSEAQRKLLFQYSLDKTDKEGLEDIAKITIVYFNVTTETVDQISCTISVNRQTTVPTDLPANPEISSNIARVKTAFAIDEATKTAENGHLEKARNILKKSRQELKNLNLSDTIYENNLCGKLLKIEEGFKNKNEYEMWGMINSRQYNHSTRCQTARFRESNKRRSRRAPKNGYVNWGISNLYNSEGPQAEAHDDDFDEYTMNKFQIKLQQKALVYTQNN